MAERVKAGDLLAESDPTEAGWVHTCGSILQAVDIHHTVHDGPFPLTGYGNVRIQKVPWCPRCYQKPSEIGAPITPSMTEWPVVTLQLNDGSPDA